MTDEIKQLNDVTQTELQKLENVKSNVTTARQNMDTDIVALTTLHIFKSNNVGTLVAAFYMTIIAILGVLYLQL